jgi:DNA mismatch endonuclease (patch repair protein)
VQNLPGRPDLVFRKQQLIVFIDGDFWHGYRYPLWKSRLSPYWRAKVERNRKRDISNHRKLRRAGWHVIRIWEHEVKKDRSTCVDRIVTELAHARVRKAHAGVIEPHPMRPNVPRRRR